MVCRTLFRRSAPALAIAIAAQRQHERLAALAALTTPAAPRPLKYPPGPAAFCRRPASRLSSSAALVELLGVKYGEHSAELFLSEAL